jgi:hypothetical protein
MTRCHTRPQTLWSRLRRLFQRSLSWLRNDKKRTQQHCETLRQWLKNSELAPMRVVQLGKTALSSPPGPIVCFSMPMNNISMPHLAETLLATPCDLTRHSVLLLSSQHDYFKFPADFLVWVGQLTISGWRVFFLGNPPSDPQHAFLASQCEATLEAPLCWQALSRYLEETPPLCWATWRSSTLSADNPQDKRAIGA